MKNINKKEVKTMDITINNLKTEHIDFRLPTNNSSKPIKFLLFIPLILCGGIIGMYLFRLTGLLGMEITPQVELLGLSLGASYIVMYKMLKFCFFV